jgi:hypothetical protein
MKSAIDWDLVTRAKKAQEKLARYFALLEEVRSLEADPDVAAFLAAGEPITEPEEDTESRDNRAAPTPVPVPQAAEQPATPIVATEPERSPRVPRGYIKRMLYKLDKADFDAPEVLAKFRENYLAHYPDFASVDARQVNDHLRRMEKDGELAKTEEGRRGLRGSFPRYKLVVKATAADAK